MKFRLKRNYRKDLQSDLNFKWKIDKKEFKKYVLICEKLREFVENYSGEVVIDYKTQLEVKIFSLNSIRLQDVK